MKTLVALIAVSLAGCATNCHTVQTSKVWTAVGSDLPEVQEANSASAHAGLTHHTMSYGPVSWYRRANGDLYRCERIEVGAILSGNPNACRVMGVYLSRHGNGWDPSLGVTSKCR